MTQYYIKIQQGRLGPLSEQEVAEMIREGALPLDALVSQVGQQDWMSPKGHASVCSLLQEPTRAAPHQRKVRPASNSVSRRGKKRRKGREEGEGGRRTETHEISTAE